jgi:hypothetical protein
MRPEKIIQSQLILGGQQSGYLSQAHSKEIDRVVFALLLSLILILLTHTAFMLFLSDT